MRYVGQKFLSMAVLATTLAACGKPEILRMETGGVAADEVRAFELTVHKLVRSKTCINCHAKSQSPLFAHDDPAIAYDALMTSRKVNFDRTELSRLYVRLAVDQHNCWYDNDCTTSSKEMLKAINEWKAQVRNRGIDLGLVTEALPIWPGGRPPIPAGAFLLEAESGSIQKAAVSATGNQLEVALDASASKGKYVQAPERGWTSLVDAGTNFTNYASVSFNFTPTPGNYRFFARLKGSDTNNDNRFKVSLNGNTPVEMRLRQSGDWHYTEIALPAAHLRSGSNTLRVGHWDDGPKLDFILAVPAASIPNYPGDFIGQQDFLDRITGRKVTLTYNLDSLIGANGVRLKVDVRIFDEAGYYFDRAVVEGYTQNIRVQGVRLLQNSLFNPQDSDWLTVNDVLYTRGAYEALDATFKENNSPKNGCPWDKYNYVSCRPLLVQRQDGPERETFAFAFESLEFTAEPPDLRNIRLQGTPEQIAMDVTQSLCINCHNNLLADNQTHFVVSEQHMRSGGDPSVLERPSTIELLHRGNFTVPNAPPASANVKPLIVRYNQERIVRPRVVLTGSQDNPNNDTSPQNRVALGAGGANSAMYQIISDRGYVGVPPIMVPLRDSIQMDPVAGPIIRASVKDWIDSLAPVNDVTPPRMIELSVRRATGEGDDDDIGGLNNGARILVRAIDDLTRTGVFLTRNNEAPVKLPLGGMREYTYDYAWPAAGTVVDPSQNHYFRAVAIDEQAQSSDAVGESRSLTLGGCMLSGPLPGRGNIRVGQAYHYRVHAHNDRAVAPSRVIQARLDLNGARLLTLNSGDTTPAVIDNDADGDPATSPASIVFPTGRDQTLVMTVANNFDDENTRRVKDVYSCSKSIVFRNRISIVPQGPIVVGQPVTFRVDIESPFEKTIQNIQLSYRRNVNSPTSVDATGAAFTPATTVNRVVSRLLTMTPTTRDTHPFRAVVTDSEGVALEATIEFTPQ